MYKTSVMDNAEMGEKSIKLTKKVKKRPLIKISLRQILNFGFCPNLLYLRPIDKPESQI